MTDLLQDVFADTVFWVAIVCRRDALHKAADSLAGKIQGRIITTTPVLMETCSALSPCSTRQHAVQLINHIRLRNDIEIVNLSPELFERAWRLYSDRPDKSWSLVDCVSFVVMGDMRLTSALTSDRHFVQAGFRAILTEE